jgi:hypothetical protein
MRHAVPLAVLTCFLLGGCSGQRKALVGKWCDEAGTTTVEFSADGKATIEQAGIVSPTWYKVKGNQLTIGATTALVPEDDVVTFKVSGDTLTMSREAAFGGTGASVWTQTFKRLKDQ